MTNARQEVTSKERIDRVLQILDHTYPTAHIALTYHTAWELLVAVMLSAQCTDSMVNKVTEKLFKKYPTFDSYLHANVETFEGYIKPTGFYHVKARHILETAKRIASVYNGKVPHTMKDLLTLPGVARKTGNVVLSNAYQIVDGIAVDTHVLRISQRLRLVQLDMIGGKHLATFIKDGKPVVDYKKDADPVKIEQQLMVTVPKDQWFGITYQIIDHGRTICKAQNPHCQECPLAVCCPVKR